MRDVHLLRGAAAIAVGVAMLAGAAAPAMAGTIKWLHLETNPNNLAAWEEIAAAYEAAHPETQIEFQFLENEAFKAKLPTLLQSNDPPSMFYTWGGGVLKEQSETGAIREIDPAFEADPAWRASIAPAAIDGMRFNDKIWAVPFQSGVVSFWYNKELFKQAGVDGTAIKTWDDFLGAVKKLKDAGITPLACGGGDKWPIHFYWSYLAMRIAGQEQFSAAKAGEGEGFAAPEFIQASQKLAELGAMEPCQDGWLGATWPETTPVFNDGRAAMILGFQNQATPSNQANNSTDGVGLSQDKIGRFPFPEVPGGKGLVTDDFGGLNGWVITKAAPPETEDFLKFYTSVETMTMLAERTGILPTTLGAEAGVKDPTLLDNAEQMGRATWHQNYVDQDLGPNVGRVVNDMSVGVFSGQVSPEEASQQIQDTLSMEM